MNRILALSILGAFLFSTTAFAETLYEKVYATPDELLDDSYRTHTLQIPTSDLAQLEASAGFTFGADTFEYFESPTSNYAFILDELGKYYPITMMVKINPAGSVEDVTIMVYRERIGAQVRKRRFLKQFFGKTSQDPLMVDRDIDGLSGATISSWSVSTAVKKALLLAEYLRSHEKMASH